MHANQQQAVVGEYQADVGRPCLFLGLEPGPRGAALALRLSVNRHAQRSGSTLKGRTCGSKC